MRYGECKRCHRSWSYPQAPPSVQKILPYYSIRGYCNIECMAADYDNWEGRSYADLTGSIRGMRHEFSRLRWWVITIALVLCALVALEVWMQ